ncbi:MAG: PulJ/GspJ family protein, partial [Elusimicrobiota bacterium]
RNKKGFTFMEVIIGTAILGVVSLTGFHFFIHGSDFIEKAVTRERALQLASGQMELLRGATYFAFIEERAEAEKTKEINDTTFAINVDILDDNEDDDGNGGIQENHRPVELSVSWDGNQELTLSTYIINTSTN